MQERFSGGFDSPLGKIRIEALNGKITLLIFENQRFAPESAAVCRKGAEGDRGESEDKTGSGASEYAVKSAIRWLEEYFSGAVPPTERRLAMQACISASAYISSPNNRVSSFSNTSMAPEKHIRVMTMPNGTDNHKWIFLKKRFIFYSVDK